MIKVRIAPSPTGDPHVGTAYTGLFNWVFARQNKGAFILRIEDTDQARSTPESEVAILQALKWLGLTWDEGPEVNGPNGPYRQSERSALYMENVKKLVEAKMAYPCFCTAARLSEMRAAQAASKSSNPGYDGHCRNISEAEAATRMENKEPYVIRLKVNKDETTVFNDMIRGEISIQNNNVDDQVLLKSDGFPTYHLANVVDDHLMGVTHVIRAEEWIPSTPKHVLLYQAFGWTPPIFVHLPLLRNKDKSKISKRKNPVSLSYYKEKGYLPEALLNFLALMGWSTSDEEEVFSLDRMVTEMDLKSIHIGSPVFDFDKLDWLNGVYIRNMALEELADRMVSGGFIKRQIPKDLLLKILPLIRERMKTLADFEEKIGYFFDDVTVSFADFKKVKKMDAPKISVMLKETADKIEALKTLEKEKIEDLLRQLATEMEVKPGMLFMALRVALTGKSVSPPLLESMEIMGEDLVLTRIRNAAVALEQE